MKLFPVRGGVHPDYRKNLANEQAIVFMPLPKFLYLPLQQHIGAPADPQVAVGDHVLKGQVVARSGGTVSAPVHAPTSGRIVKIGDEPAPHPSGLPQPAIVLETDGKDEEAALAAPLADPLAASADEISARVSEAGIVGMGGATFPASVKLKLGQQLKIDILLLNGAECEPYLTCDDRLMREHSDEVMDGARIMAHALGAKRIIVAIEDNKPAAQEAMRRAASGVDGAEVIGVPVQYPMGSERHLTQAVTGRETPIGKLTAHLGVVVHNVATARAIHHALRFGRPLLSRIVTVTGRAVAQPKNVEVLLGTKVSELVDFCGGFSTSPARLVSGGPMMGAPLPSLDVPVVKGMSGVLGLTAAEVNENPTQPCIRCGTCVDICPCGLIPVEMAAFIRNDKLEDAAKLGVKDCFSCGSCSYICPSNVPLVHYFNYAKGVLNAKERDRRKREQTKVMVAAHGTRLEKIAQARKAAAAAAKAKAQSSEANKATGA